VALDRQSIERKDFPVGRRGYDPEAVDAHLNALADEIDELKRSARRKSETLASSASEQVRAIVQAAETSAADIQRQAEEEAREIRDEANSEAENTREQATAQARDYVGKVSESTSSMLQRLDAMESELTALIESLRTGSNRLNADLQLLEGNLTEVGDAVSPRPRFEPEPVPEPQPEPEPEPEPEVELEMIEAEIEVEPVTLDGGDPLTEVTPPPTLVDGPMAQPEPAPAPQFAEPLTQTDTNQAGITSLEAPAIGVSDDTEGARLIALNMALNGTPREETERYLSTNFSLPDRDALLDEVYASVEG
jgi:DivIVA domain-containing protein